MESKLGKQVGTIFQRNNTEAWSISVKDKTGKKYSKQIGWKTNGGKDEAYLKAQEWLNETCKKYNINKNSIRYIDDSTIEVNLTRDQKMITDSKFVDICLKYALFANKSGQENSCFYAYLNIDNKNVGFHNYITGFKMVDHINRNSLDNRLINLREVNHKINNNNRTSLVNTSGFLGVSFNAKDNSWRARIKQDGKEYTKSFSLAKYGDDAKQMAIDYRIKLNTIFNCNNSINPSLTIEKNDLQNSETERQIEKIDDLSIDKYSENCDVENGKKITIINKDTIKVTINQYEYMITDYIFMQLVNNTELYIRYDPTNLKIKYVCAYIDGKLIDYHNLITNNTYIRHKNNLLLDNRLCNFECSIVDHTNECNSIKLTTNITVKKEVVEKETVKKETAEKEILKKEIVENPILYKEKNGGKRKEHKIVDNIELKHCYKCDDWLELCNFSKNKQRWDNLDNRCNFCYKKYVIDNKEKIMLKKKEYKENNKEKIKEWKNNNKEKISQYNKNYLSKYREVNKEELAKKQQEYYQVNKKEINKRRNESINKNPVKKIQRNLRSRVNVGLTGKCKSEKTKQLLGCTIDELKIYLEKQFTEGMTWDNYGEWHVDHILPVSKFDITNEIEQHVCFHYQNLQPLWAKENISKGCKMVNLDKTELMNRLSQDVILKLKEFKNQEEYNASLKYITTLFKLPKEKKKISLVVKDTSLTLKKYYGTQIGQESKKQAHLKRSETMEKQREIVRQNITEKVCNTCQNTLSIDNFHKKTAAKDGLQPNCKDCINRIKREKRMKK